MRNFIGFTLAGAVLAASAGVSAANTSTETVVVPVGPASIKVVEIGVPPVRQADAKTRSTR